MAAVSVVTPVNSQENDSIGDDWCAKIQAGIELTQADWEQLAREKTQLPILDRRFLEGLESSEQHLVRVRGMVQDMLEAEYYVTDARDDREETAIMPAIASPANLAERTPLVIAPVPFTTGWFRRVLREEESDSSSLPSSHRDKRMRFDDVTANNNDGRHGPKENGMDWWPQHQMKSDPEQIPVVAKLYYEQYGGGQDKRLRLNEIVELVGVIEAAGVVNMDIANQQEESTQNALEGVAVDAPQEVPRLHVLWFSVLDMDHMAHAFSRRGPTLSPPIEPSVVLARSLAIPEVPASALWMTLLSLAEREPLQESLTWAPVRMPNDTTLGCGSLNLILPDHVDASLFQDRLEGVLSQVVPVVTSLRVSADRLAQVNAPCKKSGRLHPTPLQLPRGSTIILNVCDLGPGRLSSEQVESLHALQQLALCHRMPYAFDGGVRIPFEADARVIVLSKAASSNILPCTLKAKCVTCNSLGDSHDRYPLGSDFRLIRDNLAAARGVDRLTTVRHHSNIGLSPAVKDCAQRVFIERRAATREYGQQGSLAATSSAVNEESLHRWLTLTRLRARERHSHEASLEDWDKALALDDAMIRSLKD